MKGIVFTEFLELVEEKFGLEMVDTIINQSELPSQGVYTAVGTYSFSEMLSLLGNLSANTGIDIDSLLMVYAEHFFGVIKRSYPGLIETYKDPIEMLSSIEDHIHIEVRKIYPDAELPTFTTEAQTDTSLVMLYQSSRAMYSFGLGLMNMTFDHFDMTADITMEKLNESGTEIRFSIVQNG